MEHAGILGMLMGNRKRVVGRAKGDEWLADRPPKL